MDTHATHMLAHACKHTSTLTNTRAHIRTHVWPIHTQHILNTYSTHSTDDTSRQLGFRMRSSPTSSRKIHTATTSRHKQLPRFYFFPTLTWCRHRRELLDQLCGVLHCVHGKLSGVYVLECDPFHAGKPYRGQTRKLEAPLTDQRVQSTKNFPAFVCAWMKFLA